jgi:HSP20 family protein
MIMTTWKITNNNKLFICKIQEKKMMTMYMTPYRRTRMHEMAMNDRIARNFGLASNEVHVPVDIKDENDAFVIYAIVPGLSAEDIDIEILNDTVSISGEFKREEENDESFLRSERPLGKFRRSFRFSIELVADQAEAKLENGILSLHIPKVPEAQPKNIKVKTK